MLKRTGPGKTEVRTAPPSLMLYNFDTDGKDLKLEHTDFLKDKAVPVLRNGGSVTLIGLTDRAGSREHNQKLSEARVAETIKFLRGEVPTGFNVRNDTAGYGERAAELEGQKDGVANDRFRTVLLFLSDAPEPPKPRLPGETDTLDPLALAKTAYGRWIQFKRAVVIFPGTGIKEPTSLRFLNVAEAREVSDVYGSSLDLTRIFISDGLGWNGRPFTVALEAKELGWIVVLNLGSFVSWNEPPERAATLVHELAHAWQSQHHAEKDRFMSMALQCQGRAQASAPHFNSDAAYWYEPAVVPSRPSPRPFGEYGTEQIAQMVEHHYIKTRGGTGARGHLNPEIVGVVKGAGRNVTVLENVSSLLVPRWETTNSPHVVR